MKFEEFVELVAVMRQLQSQFFHGHRHVLKQAKKIEGKVDQAIAEIRGGKLPEQPELPMFQ